MLNILRIIFVNYSQFRQENEDASDKEDESTEIDQFGLDDENPDMETQEQGGEEEKENDTVQVNEDDKKGII